MDKKEKMHFKIGSPVTGNNFFPRPGVIKELKAALEDHVLFLAPRRTGKTSILYHLRTVMDTETAVFFINLEKFKTPQEWVGSMMECLLSDRKFHSILRSMGKSYEKIMGQFNRIESIEASGIGMKLRESVGDNWKRTAEMFLHKLTKMEHRVLFLLDEFPILVKQIEKQEGDVENMLRWFRDWRQDYKTDRIKFLVTGSIGLDNVARKMGLEDTINDFNTISLPPLTKKEAIEFMEKLSQDNGFQLSLRAKTTILEYLGPPWPYFLQIFLAEIKNRQDRENIKLTSETIKRIYHEHMVFGPKNKYLSHMFGRLREIFSHDELRLGRAVLKECAQKPAGITRSDIQKIHRRTIKDNMLRDEEQMDYVMDVLKHDGYLIQDVYGEQKTKFFSNMLKDYWKRRLTG